ncbi:phytyl ester synthase 1, chloroplastic [Arachis duranensis]|uniref:Phytyl ester synthase 1, chloroplastic n=1 Tax=Arachis duranensis TaxID=130453 RepID=A0A6P5M9E6_ARADU|nr:phytyl ester synthase 1, chloroplastic [Arachis duranensis]
MASTSIMSFGVSPFSAMRPRFRVQAQNLDGPVIPTNTVLPSESDSAVTAINGVSSSSSLVLDTKHEKNDSFIVEKNKENGKLIVEEKRKGNDADDAMVLEPLWDDGYGTQTVEDYFAAAKEIINGDGGPPRWFCPVECGSPLKNSPTLLFLPGLDGTGFGLTLHHKALGKAFEVRCLHIPVLDRTPFEGLVKLVEEAIKVEYALAPNKPIYLVGDSFGGCLALAVAARNPTIDLVLILVNPATSFGRSQLQPLFPILEALPNELHVTVPFLLSFVMGEPMKMASVSIENSLPPAKKLEQLSSNLTALLPCLPELANIMPKETLIWKLKLIKTAAAYANSRLHAVKAEVLVLASGKDNMLPSKDEAQRLARSIQNCRVRNFKDSGHTLLLEDGIGLLTIIRGTCMYRLSRRHDLVRDYIPISMNEFKTAMDIVGLLRFLTGSVVFSTLEDGKIVQGLDGVPVEGPVIYVGYHMLLGVDLPSLVEEFITQKGIVLRGISHPELFEGRRENASSEFGVFDWMKIFGSVPVSGSYLFKLLKNNSHILLYPGGQREALHYKGEEYKVIWPDHPEFVRMAARFGATIVPFGTVGEDDIADIVLDFNDLAKIPYFIEYVRELQRGSVKFRDEISGEVASRDIAPPLILPKLPGRFYYLFGKPISTKGMENMLKDREAANKLYLKIKSEVENNMGYLLKKRQEDPYRNFIDRRLYQTLYPRSESDQTPTFKI